MAASLLLADKKKDRNDPGSVSGVSGCIQQTDGRQTTGKKRSQEAAEPVRRTEPVLPEELHMPEAEFFTEEQAAEKSNHNQMILDMYRNGKDAVEIAKELGLGVGEVKLVIGLFREEEL